MFHRRRVRIPRVRNRHGISTVPSKGDKVVVAMSGGVDSSVTAKLLADPSNGYDLSAVFMRNWDSRDESGTDVGCEWKQDWEDVQRVCRLLDIPVRMVDLSREYWLRVFEPSLRDWATGLSPNPDVWCNKEVKFGALLDSLTKDPILSNAWLATGHYANKTWSTHGTRPRPMLTKASDAAKDQTYYLSSITENSLSRALFPLAHLTKPRVRSLAMEWKLPTATRDESVGLCFVGERRRFSDFLSQYIVPKPGPIVDMTNGERVGVHQGMWSYTIGQGAKISGMPQRMFVARKDPETDTIFVVPGADHPALYVESVRVRDFSWIWADGEPNEVSQPRGLEVHVKCRHRMTDVPCTMIRMKFPWEDTPGLHIVFDTPQKGIAPGQIATVYSGDCTVMRAVVQRVTSASVAVDGKVISSISKGLMVLVGIGTDDTPADVDVLSNKILSLRVFSDANGAMWKTSVKDVAGEVLCVSQFTLLANTSKGNKPDFHRAMSSESSRELYGAFLDKMKQLYVPDRIKDGQFGAMMDVNLTNEGPVTFTLDSRKFEYITDKGEKNRAKADSPGSADSSKV